MTEDTRQLLERSLCAVRVLRTMMDVAGLHTGRAVAEGLIADLTEALTEQRTEAVAVCHQEEGTAA